MQHASHAPTRWTIQRGGFRVFLLSVNSTQTQGMLEGEQESRALCDALCYAYA